MMKYVADEHAKHNQQFDHVQMVLQKKQERGKYALTEEDANLMLSHSVEKSFADGETIIETGKSISVVYRVKSGKVVTHHAGAPIELTKGWFIGEHLFISNAPYVSIKTFKAVGPVVLYELNTSFVRQLLEIDTMLSVKFYKYLASKYATIVNRLSDQMLCAEEMAVNMSPAVSTRSNHKRVSNKHSYKVYPVVSIRDCCNGVQTIGLSNRGIEMVAKSFGFKWRVRIEFSKFRKAIANDNIAITIEDTSDKSTNVVFKNAADREEFIKLLSSITSLDVVRTPRSTPPVETKEPEVDEEMAKRMFASLQITTEYKKGDIIIEQGDLFQRVYVLGNGTFDVLRNDKLVTTLNSGQVLGVASLMYLRPVHATLVVSSETATVHMLPGYKIAELVQSNPSHARQHYLSVAKHLEQLVANMFQLPQNK